MNRLLTKADRDNSRATQFDWLLRNGYKKIEYKNLFIFIHETDFYLKSFWGTAANHTDFFRYRTIELLTAKVNSLKAAADSREEWKAKQKEANKGKSSSHAAASAAIKQELKKVFPSVKFSVKSDSFSGGNSVHVNWSNGPTTGEVDNIIDKYQYGHFNGMEDIYEYSNQRTDIPQAKYVSSHRDISNEISQEVEKQLELLFDFSNLDYNDQPNRIAHRLLYHTSIPDGFKSFEVKRNDKTATSGIENFFYIQFVTDEAANVKPETVETEVEVKGKIKIVDYSEKAFAVVGDLTKHYEGLIKIGGSYNPRLKCGKGIIFSKRKLEDVKSFLISSKN
jgi:hypothetical protein